MRRTGWIIGAAAIALTAAMAAPAQAAGGKGTLRIEFSGDIASAQVGSGVYAVEVSLWDKGTQTTQLPGEKPVTTPIYGYVAVTEFTDATRTSTVRTFGCDLDTRVLHMGRDLRDARAATFTCSAHSLEYSVRQGTPPVDVLTVTARWKGHGKVHVMKAHSKRHYDGITSEYRIEERSRDADVQLSVTGAVSYAVGRFPAAEPDGAALSHVAYSHIVRGLKG